VLAVRASPLLEVQKLITKKMKYELHYAELPMDADIPCLSFNGWNELAKTAIEKLNSKDDKRVYLYQYGGLENPIIISNNPYHLVKYFETDELRLSTCGFFKHFIQEYESYEDAYAVAKDMMEPHELCYSS
jgi:hypothetical protein